MEGGNNQVRMNLENMKVAMEACEAAATTMEAVIEDVQTTMVDLEDDYIGEDANTLQDEMKNFLDNEVENIRLHAESMKKALEQGLENARYCKNYCQHFVDALGGGANEATNDNEEIPGAMFCDYDAVEGLMKMCTEAERLGDEIRQSTYKIENVLNLEVVSFDVTYYTSAVREECDKIDRLEVHKRNLEDYASFVETTDTELASSLGGIYDFIMNPESVEIGNLEYGSIDAEIVKMQERESALDELEIEIIFEYMSKPVNRLTEEERRAMENILTVLIENGATGELEKIVNYIGNGIGGAWTAGDLYAAAKILSYSEDTNNEELTAEIYNKIKREKMIATVTTEDSDATIYTYEMWMDKRTVQGILNELNPKDDGLAYYSLQRRSKYTASAKKVMLMGPATKEPESPFELSFKTEDGRLVSVFKAGTKKVELSSVDMNEVAGIEGIANLRALKFSPEETVALLSCIYTDEDIILIGNLAKAATEEEYRKVFQSDPNELSVYTKMGLYNYSLVLLDKNVEYDDKMRITKQGFTQLEHFINGMLYTKPDYGKHDPFADREENLFTIDYRGGYLEAMLMSGDIQVDIARALIADDYSNVPYVGEILPYYAENVQLVALYATLADRKSVCSARGAAVYNRISGLGIYDDPLDREMGADMNHALFSYCDEIRFDDKPYMRINKDGKKEPITAIVQIREHEGNIIFRDQSSEDYMEKAREAKHAIRNTGFSIFITVASSLSGKLGIATAIADGVRSISSAFASQEEAQEAERRMNAALGGAQIVYTDDEHPYENPVLVLTGCYDANALLKQEKLKREGLGALIGMDKYMAEEIADSIAQKVIMQNFNDGESEMDLYAQYLLFTGKAYKNEEGDACPVQEISDIDPNSIRAAIDEIEERYREKLGGFDYISYNILESEYMDE